MGAELNASTSNSLGNLGLGFDLSRVSLKSNNLGERKRTMLNMFVEQQVMLNNDKIDFTPGLAITYFSDVSTKLNYQNNFFNNFDGMVEILIPIPINSWMSNLQTYGICV